MCEKVTSSYIRSYCHEQGIGIVEAKEILLAKYRDCIKTAQTTMPDFDSLRSISDSINVKLDTMVVDIIRNNSMCPILGEYSGAFKIKLNMTDIQLTFMEDVFVKYPNGDSGELWNRLTSYFDKSDRFRELLFAYLDGSHKLSHIEVKYSAPINKEKNDDNS